MKKQKTIFIVEDDLLSAEYLKEILQKENYTILDITNTGEDAIQKCSLIKPDVILMDIMLKGPLSGAEAAVKIKHSHPECKIIFLTAYANPEMIEYAVEAKAYAYLMKPYRDKEIIATLKVALNDGTTIPHTTEEDKIIVLKSGFSFHLKERRFYKKDQEVPLSSKKLKLIELLAKNKNHAVSNEQISMYVWDEIKSNSTLRSLIYRFKSTINDDIISNVNGVGYAIYA